MKASENVMEQKLYTSIFQNAHGQLSFQFTGVLL